MQDAQEWIRGSHTPQDAQAIHQLNQIYKQREKNKQEALKKAEEEAKRRRAKGKNNRENKKMSLICSVPFQERVQKLNKNILRRG